MPDKAKVTVDPRPVRWAAILTVGTSGYDRREQAWLHIVVRQLGILVFEGYLRGPANTFMVGPTPAADESKVATGNVEVGYFTKQGGFRPVGTSDTFDVVP